MLGVTLDSLYVDTQVYVPALLNNLRGMSCSGAYWLLGGGWLSVFWRSMVPFYCGGFTQWVGLDNWFVKVS